MHRDKTVARILLILSVVHVAAAAPAIERQRSLDVDEDVTAASEKRGYPGGTSQDLSPVSQMGIELPTTSGIPPSQNDPSPESGTAQLHNDQPQTSGPSPSKDSQSHNGTPEGSNDPQSHDAPSQWRPPSGLSDGNSVHSESLSVSSQELDPVPQMNNDLPPASGAPHDPTPASGTSHLDNDPHPDYHPLLATSETSSVHDDPPLRPDTFDEALKSIGSMKLTTHPRRTSRTGRRRSNIIASTHPRRTSVSPTKARKIYKKQQSFLLLVPLLLVFLTF